MKALTIFNFLLLPTVIGVFWWAHARYLNNQFQKQTAELRIMGYNFEVVDQTTQQPIPTLPAVTVDPPGLAMQVGGVNWSQTSMRVHGRWIGRPHQKITVIVPGYEPKSMEVDCYPDTPQKLELSRLPTK